MPSPEEMLADWEQRVQQQTFLAMELSRRMEEVRGSAHSLGGEVAITVDSAGGLAELKLSDQAMRMRPEDLASLILETSRRAQARLAQRVTAVTRDLYGDDSETASFIGGVYASKFPHQLDDEER